MTKKLYSTISLLGVNFFIKKEPDHLSTKNLF